MRKALNLSVVCVALVCFFGASVKAELINEVGINTGHANWSAWNTGIKTYIQGNNDPTNIDWLAESKNFAKSDSSWTNLSQNKFSHSAYVAAKNNDNANWISTGNEVAQPTPTFWVFRVWIEKTSEQTLHLNWSADNNIAAFVLGDSVWENDVYAIHSSFANGSDYGGLGAFAEAHTFQASVELNGGGNWLYAIVQNVNSNTANSPMGLYVEGSYRQFIVDESGVAHVSEGGGGGSTPEPATLAVFAIGLIGAGFAARKRVSK